MKLLTLTIVLLVLSACLPSPADTPATATAASLADGSIVACVSGAEMTVCQVQFSDGTNCIVMDGVYSGGIDCDFK